MCVFACVCVCMFSPYSYFLGELEKCLAEPERLAQLFIKHVSITPMKFDINTHTNTHTLSFSAEASGSTSLCCLS